VLLDVEQLKASLLVLDPLGTREPALWPAEKVLPASPHPATSALPRTVPLTETQTATAAEIKGYRDRCEELNKRHESLAQAEREAFERFRDLEKASVSQIEPVRRQVILDRPRWQRYIALMAGMAGTLGLGLAWLAKRGDRAFHSAEQVGRELGLTIVGATAATKLSAGRVAYLAQRGIRTTCEALTAIILIGLAMLALLDGAFLAQITSDPLAAIALAWQHTLG
jgi:hypothetical protein